MSAPICSGLTGRSLSPCLPHSASLDLGPFPGEGAPSLPWSQDGHKGVSDKTQSGLKSLPGASFLHMGSSLALFSTAMLRLFGPQFG